MKDVNWELRKAYTTALAGITYNSNPVPVFYQNAPDDVTAKNYIVFSGISNGDSSTLNSSDTTTSIRVSIYTYNEKINAGRAADDLAGIVLSRIYPNPQFNLTLEGFQVTSTRLSGDSSQDFSMVNQKTYINRFLTFRHQVYHQ